MSGDFTLDQKRYLEGFVSGAQVARVARAPGGAPAAEPIGPDAAGLKAQARTEAEGKKLTPEEKAKREEMGLDAYSRMEAAAVEGVFPKGPDILRWKYHGLFYVAPAQDSFMCRMRMPNGI
ncbi:MAG: ferredoxin--nitrite reductase, partial [Azorhizobium sp. 35-67-5]